MKKVLVIGATGGLGKKVVEELKKRKYFIRALATSEESSNQIKSLVDEVVIADASQPEAIEGICEGIDIVFSALGKNVSLFSHDDRTFFEVDYIANKNILDEAKKSHITRFVYISIYGSDRYEEFELAKVHRDMETELAKSKMSYTIIRPVGMFVGLLDVLRMAKNGIVITVGDGEAKTNSIHEDDLAIVCADNLEKGPNILEVGGPIIYTRNHIAELAIKATGGSAQHIHIPEIIAQGGLPLINLYDQNFFDKLAFFKNILTRDVIAHKYGSQKLEDYFNKLAPSIKENWADLIA